MRGAQPSDQDLIKAARGLITEEGAEALTMDRLASLTGVSRATLYRRLGSRKAILAALGGEEGEDIETRILQAARFIFTRDGLPGATVEAIALKAGVGPATVYRRFGGREGLLRAFMEEARPSSALGNLELSQSMPLEASLVTFADQTLRHLRANQDILLLLLTESRRPNSPLGDVRDLQPGKTISRLRACFEQLIRAGHLVEDDPTALALAFILPLLGEAVLRPRLEGAGASSAIAGDLKIDTKAYASAHVRRFLRGATPREGE